MKLARATILTERRGSVAVVVVAVPDTIRESITAPQGAESLMRLGTPTFALRGYGEASRKVGTDAAEHTLLR
jgi:hypothetical protein